ncbi:magnesium chelatase ATPase subunit D [Falsiroseomonas bella]|uniref:Magnesium chelatase ATPase subunit D n=1 Tax=Falsiroseomonas bella TaxID=2184016 RepID=A0A317FIZ8_9PROT|nr:magnesium chelatase subunit D [Falsiroseomonas bella]PWS39031.1 magnesium chelatase ATPase subunit D [Falsiroseomonas bella]
MTTPGTGEGGNTAADIVQAALLLAVDPVGLGGAVLRGPPGAARDAWLATMRAALPLGTPWRRLPLGVPDSRLLGGLDLSATLAAGRPIAERGVLAEADGGIVLAAMAERMETATAARICAVMDAGAVVMQRDGLSDRLPARFGLVALDEGIAPEEVVPAALRARLAFHIALPESAPASAGSDRATQDARALLPHVTLDDDVAEALCAAAAALGIDDPRAPLFALRAARAAAALAGRLTVSRDDANLAARLVLASRATRLPAHEEEQPEQPPPEPPPPDTSAQNEDQPDRGPDERDLQEMLVAAARAALPAGLLEALQLRDAARKRNGAEGKAGARRDQAQRGRPVGTRAGQLRSGARLALVETLRNAAPWQPLRRRERPHGPPIQVRKEDIRLRRFRHKAGTTAIFVVDASGSAALHRLAEAKGAVEMLLADCYVRRDQVAVVAFRGQRAEVLLPPTPSLVRAKRSLAGLPGGGPTPLASGMEAAAAIAADSTRRGRTPLLVLLTDGRANIARDGTQGRPAAEADALAAAAPIRLAGIPSLLVDTAPRPHPFAKRVAEAMGARYLPLPAADSARLSGAVAAARPA